MIAFDTQGPLLSFTAATTAPTSVQAVSLDGVGEQQYMITNTSTSVDCVVGWADSDSKAQTASASGSTITNCVYLMARSQIVITGPRDAFFSGKTAASTAVVYVQTGYGI